MNRIVENQRTCLYKYTFILKSKTEMTIDEAFYINSNHHEYRMMGNALGGIIRNHLKNTTMSHKEILKFMGGVEEEEKQKFKDSSVYISDVKIESSEENPTSKGLIIKEGTAIDGASGTAKEQQKYSRAYLPVGSKLEFQLEIQEDYVDKPNISKTMRTIVEGIEGGGIRFGGLQNNNFGQASVEKILISEYCFNTVNDLEGYLLGKADTTGQSYTLDEFRRIAELPYVEDLSRKDNITIEIEGRFPYGVYQNFNLESDSTNSITGIQNKSIPSSSLKGLLRHETEKMINTLMKMETDKANKPSEKMNIIFGGNDSRGKVMVYNIEAPNEEVKVLRPEGNEANTKGENQEIDENPKYIKIDRLTGGKVDKALITTREYRGDTNIKVEVSKEDEGYLFPILFSCLQIAQGRLPIGGRTSVGLGVFEGKCIKINGNEFKIDAKGNELNQDLKNLLGDYYTKFKGWCNKA